MEQHQCSRTWADPFVKASPRPVSVSDLKLQTYNFFSSLLRQYKEATAT